VPTVLTPEPVLSAAHAQPPASVYLRISLSAQPFRRVRPAEPTSRPELELVEPVVPEVVRLITRALELTARPLPVRSVKPSPLTVRVLPAARVRALLTVTVPAIEEPMLTLVVEEAVAEVPMLIVWVLLPPAAAPMEMVLVAVDWPRVIVPVWVVLPITTVLVASDGVIETEPPSPTTKTSVVLSWSWRMLALIELLEA
jgi:hypothetical protein